ncbi:MAG TPA: tRNA (adenosine(37)-N6)-threonylcarbamoyltransferase complex ATPase subunit type 1 TsaE [Chloroflexota bacterium]|nr:tRNA (adenosine(37)-N6)-threonylcarbamoyltransferase complex ATPase subunit type 1 TsaE [Chloroflexota bacterium]
MDNSALSTQHSALKTCRTNSPEETRSIGRQAGQAAQPGDVILLVGELGAGKTAFTQGLAAGLGVLDTVNSPTFVLLREYHGRLTLYHYDLYRLGNIEETVGREWQEFLYGDGVSAVEWANRANELLPPEHLLLEFAIESDTGRVLHMTGVGQRHIELLSAIQCS